MQDMYSMPMRVQSLICRPAAIPVLAVVLALSIQANANGPDGQLVGTNLPPHPRLLLNAQGLAELKQRIATTPWASASWSELKAGVDRGLAQPVVLPPRGGNWSHNYVCPIHSVRLSQGKQIGPWQWEHICPVGGHVLRGDPSKATLDFDGNSIAGAHARYAQEVINAGLVYQVTGDLRYAHKARDILLAYAQRYLSYPLHDNQGEKGKGGRVASQSLTEATWLIDIAQGADLVWATLNDSERDAVTDKVLRPALDQVIIPRRLGIHNIQCRHNSAIGLVGLLLDDDKLIARAIDDPAIGFRQQLEKGVQTDGLWLEGSSGYHFFTIAGLWPLAEAARNCGLNLYGQKFASMFDGPISLAMPNLVLPNFNDSGTVPLQNQSDLYELAFARFGNSNCLPLLAASERRGRMALLFGVTNLPPCGNFAAAGSHTTASGYSILQKGQGTNSTWLCLKYGPHGGGHGHPDKNTFILYSRGQILATDAGTHAYGSPLHRDWDKTTFAHNTLVTDETSQHPATGQSLAFGEDHGIEYSISAAGPIYDGVKFIRTAVLLSPQLVLFVDQIQADQPHTFDLAYHQIGSWQELPAGKPWPRSSSPGYTHLTQAVLQSSGSQGFALQTITTNGLHPLIILAAGEPTDVVTGYGVLNSSEDLVPLLLQRRHAKDTAFAWALSLDGSPVDLRLLGVHDAGGLELFRSEAAQVQLDSGGRRWSLLVNPHQHEVTSTSSAQTPLRTKAPFATLAD